MSKYWKIIIIFLSLLLIIFFNIFDIHKGTYSNIILEDILVFDFSLEVDEENMIIKYIDENTKVSEIINKISVKGDYKLNAFVTTYSGVNKEDDSYLATGDILVINVSDKTEKYKIAVRGDINGNGKVTLTDLSLVRKHIAGWKNPNTGIQENITGVNLFAVDMNGDDDITLIDLVSLRKKISKYGEDPFYIKIDVNEIDLDINENKTIKYFVYPSDATDKTVTWKSSNTDVATVSSSGKITAKAVGTATITAKTSNGKTAKCIVTVYPVISEVTLNETILELDIAETSILTATINPDGVRNKKITWTSSNTDVATVSSSGKITAKAVGTATITAKTTNGKTAKCTVTVINLVKNITLNRLQLELEKGSSFQLTPIFDPVDASNKTLTWTSSDTSVVTVTDNGLVKAVGKGSATVIVETSNGKKNGCLVVVSETSLKLTSTSLELDVGDQSTISAIISGNTISDITITWTSSNTEVATISNSGKITAKAVGTAIITAKTSNGKTAKCTVIVNALNDGVDKIHFLSVGNEFEDLFKASYNVSINAGNVDKLSNIDPSETILLQSNGKYALIDTGLRNGNSYNPNRSEYVLDYLEKLNVKELDFILITHADHDHMGGAKKIINEYKSSLGAVYTKVYHMKNKATTDSITHTETRYNDVKTAAGDLLKIVDEKFDSVLTLGDMKIYLYATTNLFEYSDCENVEEENSNSIVTYITVNNNKILLTGDLEPVSKKCLESAYPSCNNVKSANINGVASYSIMGCVLEQNSMIKDLNLLQLSHHNDWHCDLHKDFIGRLTNSDTKLVATTWQSRVRWLYPAYMGVNYHSCYDTYFSDFNGSFKYVGDKDLVYDFTN